MIVKTELILIILLILTVPCLGQIISISDSDSLLEEDYIFRGKPNIAVLPFYDANAQAKEVEFGRTVSAMLATALRSNTNFVVLERGEINQILTEQAVGISGFTREMIAVWKDPDFDPKLSAVYYARVIEIPTPRWTAYEAKRFGIKMGPEVPMITQERAYTSPIWYTP